MLPISYTTRSDLSQEQQKLKATCTPHGSDDYMTRRGSFLVTDDLSASTSSAQYSNPAHPLSLSLPPPPPPLPLTPLPTASSNLTRRVSPTLPSSYGAQYRQSTPTPPETLAPLASLHSAPGVNSKIGYSFQTTGNGNDTLQHHSLFHGSSIPSLPPPPPPATESVVDRQKCTRCKRWRAIGQFQNDDSSLPSHAGCLECRESARKYGQSEYGKATRRNYNQTEKAKETRKKYAQSEKGRESRKKYAQTDKAKEVRRKYNRSAKAKETRKRRALIQSERQQEQEGGRIMDASETFDLVPEFMGSLDFNHSQAPNDNMKSMEKVFWQTVSKTMYDRSKKQSDEHDELEVDIRLKCMPGK